MPYGIDKDLGGDNESNDGWMEKCVSSVEKSGKDKGSAVAICKAQLRKKKMKKRQEQSSLTYILLESIDLTDTDIIDIEQ